ncbi:MAG TPA: Mg2+ and Co2+ transporter CorB [Clostridiaceae bacterium]|nr:Mg2+ and Co2+ transporter CorB [Clostridiaceae bacterium]
MDESYKHPTEEKKVRFRTNLTGSKKENIKWIITITLASFITSALLSFISSAILEDIHSFIAIFVVLIIIFIGIVFDIIGVAVTAADEVPFHAMASRKYYGARQAIRLIRNANKVSSFCNDVVGDICGVISGSASALIIVRLTQNKSPQEAVIASLVVGGLVAALTIGGKAVGKIFAMGYSNYIVYKVGVITQFVTGRISFLKNSKINKGKQKKKN